jgi:hypothetical protein
MPYPGRRIPPRRWWHRRGGRGGRGQGVADGAIEAEVEGVVEGHTLGQSVCVGLSHLSLYIKVCIRVRNLQQKKNPPHRVIESHVEERWA